MQNAIIKNFANCAPVSMASFIQIHLFSSPTQCDIYEGWNFNSGNYLFTTDTK